jgi:hypothetical protein
MSLLPTKRPIFNVKLLSTFLLVFVLSSSNAQRFYADDFDEDDIVAVSKYVTDVVDKRDTVSINTYGETIVLFMNLNSDDKEMRNLCLQTVPKLVTIVTNADFMNKSANYLEVFFEEKPCEFFKMYYKSDERQRYMLDKYMLIMFTRDPSYAEEIAYHLIFVPLIKKCKKECPSYDVSTVVNKWYKYAVKYHRNNSKRN